LFKDKDKNFSSKDKDCIVKNKDKDYILVLKKSLRTRTNITDYACQYHSYSLCVPKLFRTYNTHYTRFDTT